MSENGSARESPLVEACGGRGLLFGECREFYSGNGDSSIRSPRMRVGRGFCSGRDVRPVPM